MKPEVPVGPYESVPFGDYVIDKGVPIPDPSYFCRGSRWPLMFMEVGDSFKAPLDERDSVSNAMNHCRTQKGRTFTLRTIGDHVRVWRVT